MVIPQKRRLLETVALVVLTVPAPACGLQDVGGMAMDRNFRGGEPVPVHPPRGQRKKVRRSKALTMQSDPVECNGPGEVVHANVEIQVGAAQGALVRGGCRLRLVNVDLVAGDGVVVDQGQLTMVGGSITARGVAIRAKGEAAVELQGVKVSGATGIEVSGKARITTEGGQVSGSGAALAVRDEAQVVLQRTALEGPIAQDPTARVTVVEAPEATATADTKADPAKTGPEG